MSLVPKVCSNVKLSLKTAFVTKLSSLCRSCEFFRIWLRVVAFLAGSSQKLFLRHSAKKSLYFAVVVSVTSLPEMRQRKA